MNQQPTEIHNFPTHFYAHNHFQNCLRCWSLQLVLSMIYHLIFFLSIFTKFWKKGTCFILSETHTFQYSSQGSQVNLHIALISIIRSSKKNPHFVDSDLKPNLIHHLRSPSLLYANKTEQINFPTIILYIKGHTNLFPNVSFYSIPNIQWSK